MTAALPERGAERVPVALPIFDVWHCAACREDWTIHRGTDDWEGECPSCGELMTRLSGSTPTPEPGQEG